MSTLTWIGGSNNKASNPADWSTGTAPRTGDDLFMTQGTINIAGNDLAGDTLRVTQGPVQINTRADARLDLSMGPGNGVNVHVTGTLRLTAQVGAANLEPLSLSGGTIRFVGDSGFAGSHTVFDDRLTGSGTITLHSGNHATESMEVKGPVGAGLTFILTDGPPKSLEIYEPRKFHATIDLPAPPLVGFVGLMGLHATSADLKNDMLLLFDGKKLVDKLHLGGNTGGLTLEQNSLGVMITSGSDAFQAGGPGSVIPLHVTCQS